MAGHSKPNILVVEDDGDIQQLVAYNLIKAGMHVSCADNAEEAYAVLNGESIDAIILDLMLPGTDGLAICQVLKQRDATRMIPIIMLTAKGEEDDIITGLQAGADDYVTKPFSPKVLVARVEAIMRRIVQGDSIQPDPHNKVISVHGIDIHPGRHEVTLHGDTLHLTGTEFAILSLLADKPGWVFTRQQIIDHVRGYDYIITPRAVDVQIFGLRKKLGRAGDVVETVRGVGYRLKE